MIDRGTLEVRSVDPAIVAAVILTKAPVLISGSGGWEKVSRPRRTSLTEWKGRDGLGYQIEFLVDYLSEEDGTTGERVCQALERLSGVSELGGPPPLVSMDAKPANLLQYNSTKYPGKQWFIETGPTWEADSVVADAYGNRLQAVGSMVISEFIRDERLEGLSAVQRNKGKNPKQPKKGAKNKRYTVRSGDTLHSIAAKQLGSSSRWKEIAKLNGIRDSKGLKVGKVIKLP